MDEVECINCESTDTEFIKAEWPDEPDVVTCYACGHDEAA